MELNDLTVLDVAWSVDAVAVCDDATVSASGDTTCVTPLEAGEHTIELVVTDPESGASGYDGITVRVDAGPGN